MKTFKVNVSFTFSGTVEVNTTTAKNAREIAESGFGLVLGQPPHANDSRIVDWDIKSHPDREVGSVCSAAPVK